MKDKFGKRPLDYVSSEEMKKVIEKLKYENEKEIENENEYYIIGYIIGTYKAEKGVPLKLFNPSKIGLKD
jgi:hypothetical protein